MAQGTFVATFDADDQMPAGRLALQAAYLREHPEVRCLGGVAIRIDERGTMLPKKTRSAQCGDMISAKHWQRRWWSVATSLYTDVMQ